MITEKALAGLSTVCNQYLKLDPNISRELEPLNGKTIKLVFDGLNVELILTINHGQFHFVESAAQIDTTISGTPLAFAQLGLIDSQTEPHRLFGNDVTIRGDTELGHQFKQILDQMDIDWEEQLAKLFGDVIAHQMGSAFRSVKRFAFETKQSVTNNLSDFIQQEWALLPPRVTVERFCHDVDELRQATDRLSARIDLIANQQEHEDK